MNGETISQQEFQRALERASGSQVLQLLVLQKLVAQEASRRKVTVDESEVTLPAELSDPSLRESATEELRTRLLVRKMILQEVSEEEKLRVYDLFKAELTTYDITVTVKDDKTAVVDEKNLPGLTLPAIKRRFGTEVAAGLAGEDGEARVPLLESTGEVVFRLAGTHSSYEELRPPRQRRPLAELGVRSAGDKPARAQNVSA